MFLIRVLEIFMKCSVVFISAQESGYCGEGRCCNNYHFKDGQCVECPAGWFDRNCSQRCPNDKYGYGCLHNCLQCAHGCDRVHGCVLYNNCSSGLFGHNCSQPCPNGKFGLGCRNSCLECAQGCDPEYGCISNNETNSIGFDQPPPSLWISSFLVTGSLLFLCIFIAIFRRRKVSRTKKDNSCKTSSSLSDSAMNQTGTVIVSKLPNTPSQNEKMGKMSQLYSTISNEAEGLLHSNRIYYSRRVSSCRNIKDVADNEENPFEIDEKYLMVNTASVDPFPSTSFPPSVPFVPDEYNAYFILEKSETVTNAPEDI
ncbi:multiple epidermal growth factor-like domains protein 10 [Saccostrea cucullata]|uniref:multiple epidermal growth factor-like domains protein 10 n=1 Tax=Saccostrea cuccullata TaxID=36930 RepID=UPI002ED61579